MQKLKAIIFDWDGTLYDANDFWENLGEFYLRSIGIEPDEQINAQVACMTLHESLLFCKEQYHIDRPFESIKADLFAFMEHGYVYELNWMPKAKELVKQLKQEGYKLAIATATDASLLDKILKKDHMDAYFDYVITCDELHTNKKSPFIYEECCRQLNVDKVESVVVEDDKRAIQTARDAGFIVYESILELKIK